LGREEGEDDTDWEKNSEAIESGGKRTRSKDNTGWKRVKQVVSGTDDEE
jgi:hypothetical protein